MSTPVPIYRAIITLSPPEAEGKLTVRLQLQEHDQVVANGALKPLRDCTLDELFAFADQLEAELGAAYAGRTVNALLEDPQVTVAVDGEQAELLDCIVLLPTTDASAETKPDIQLINDVPEIEDVPVQLTESDEATDDVLADDHTDEILVEAEQDADTEEIEIEELPPRDDEIAVQEPEPIHDEPESADTLTDLTRDPDSETRTAGILSDGSYPQQNATIIWLDERPLRIMQAHAKSSMRREVAGVMIGPRPEKQPDGRYLVHVRDMIVAKHTRMSGASVTYTPESWRYMNDKLAEKYPDDDMVMVGWYHTHPGFGIFLSNMDLFIHTNFFTQKWHIAYVLDPVGERSGFFSWDRGKAQVIPYRFAWPQWCANSW